MSTTAVLSMQSHDASRGSFTTKSSPAREKVVSLSAFPILFFSSFPSPPLVSNFPEKHTTSSEDVTLELHNQIMAMLAPRPSERLSQGPKALPQRPQPAPSRPEQQEIKEASTSKPLTRLPSRPLPSIRHSEPIPQSVRLLPQRPTTIPLVTDEVTEAPQSIWRPTHRPRASSASVFSVQANEDDHAATEMEALRRRRHIRRPRRSQDLAGPRPLPALPGSSATLPLPKPARGETPFLKRAATVGIVPQIQTTLSRSNSDPGLTPIYSPTPTRPNLSILIPSTSSDGAPSKISSASTTTSSPSQASYLDLDEQEDHTLDDFPPIDYASIATPSAWRRPPPSAVALTSDTHRPGTVLLDWQSLGQALEIDGDMAVTPGPTSNRALPWMDSFAHAPPVPAIPRRFLDEGVLCLMTSAISSADSIPSLCSTIWGLQITTIACYDVEVHTQIIPFPVPARTCRLSCTSTHFLSISFPSSFGLSRSPSAQRV